MSAPRTGTQLLRTLRLCSSDFDPGWIDFLKTQMISRSEYLKMRPLNSEFIGRMFRNETRLSSPRG